MPPEFTPKEMRFLQDVEFLTAKREIVSKIERSLGELREAFRRRIEETGATLPESMDFANGKISKGENYRGLPYLVLDFPRLFHQEDVMAVRTMVWWGHEASCALHLQGAPLERRRGRLAAAWGALVEGGYWLCVNDTPFEYHFGESNYLPCARAGEAVFMDKARNAPFVKLSRKAPLSRWDEFPGMAESCLELYLGLMAERPAQSA